MGECSCFPEAGDVLSEILKRLPLESVRQCMCVQKSWYSLVKTRDFKILHFNYHKSTDFRFFYSESLVFDGKRFIEEDLIPEFSKDKPSGWWKSYSKPSHCLICFACDYVTYSRTYLWNPATREVKILPHNRNWESRKLSAFQYSRKLLAFGYSRKNDFNLVKDFIVAKVLVCQTLEEEKWSVMVDVYSLSSNSWKRVEVRDDYVVELFRGTKSNLALINGVIYCWNEERIIGENKIVGFNIENEITREIVLPPECVANDFVIQDFNESVSLIVKVSHLVEMWVLEDEEENGIWRKKISVNIQGLCAWPPVLGFRSNGELVLKTSDWGLRSRLVSCNVETGDKMVIFYLKDCLCFHTYPVDGYVFKHTVFVDNLFLRSD